MAPAKFRFLEAFKHAEPTTRSAPWGSAAELSAPWRAAAGLSAAGLSAGERHRQEDRSDPLVPALVDHRDHLPVRGQERSGREVPCGAVDDLLRLDLDHRVHPQRGLALRAGL